MCSRRKSSSAKLWGERRRCPTNPYRAGRRCVLVEDSSVAFLVTVLVTIANVPPSPLIAQPNGLIACIHRGRVAVCHSCSLSVLETLGEPVICT